MKQSLNLRQGQHLTMTPQLQQAIKLLQMSTLDLQQEIQQALESNIMLEINDEEISSSEDTPIHDKKSDNSDTFTSEGSQSNIPDELATDSSWDDTNPSRKSTHCDYILLNNALVHWRSKIASISGNVDYGNRSFKQTKPTSFGRIIMVV